MRIDIGRLWNHRWSSSALLEHGARIRIGRTPRQRDTRYVWPQDRRPGRMHMVAENEVILLEKLVQVVRAIERLRCRSVQVQERRALSERLATTKLLNSRMSPADVPMGSTTSAVPIHSMKRVRILASKRMGYMCETGVNNQDDTEGRTRTWNATRSSLKSKSGPRRAMVPNTLPRSRSHACPASPGEPPPST